MSSKGRLLFGLGEWMAREGSLRADDRKVEEAFRDFELPPHRAQLREALRKRGVENLRLGPPPLLHRLAAEHGLPTVEGRRLARGGDLLRRP